ncbi:hypothetical protein Q6247_26710, partial [Klebsiella pneumoniae]
KSLVWESLQIRGAKVTDFVGDHSCPSTDLPQEIRPKSQPNAKNEKSLKISPEIPKKINLRFKEDGTR